ncbi:MAG: hypothetical protein ABII22_03750 [Candidatus Micrarchaeota archaeon]
MSKYLVLEIGGSVRTEFLMKNGEYEETEDAVLIGHVDAESESEALDAILNQPDFEERKFDHLIAYKILR